MAQHVIMRMVNEWGHNWLCVREVAESLENSVIAELWRAIDNMGLSDYFVYQKSRPWSIRTRCHGTGRESRILFSGIDKEEKLKSLSNITGIWFEEPTESKRRKFLELVARMRGQTRWNKQVLLSFNPMHVENYIYDLFFGESAGQFAPQSLIKRVSYLDNRFIDDDYRKYLESLKETDPHYYRVYCLGEWGTTEEIIYRTFKEATFEKFDKVETWYGLDFGFTAPSALVQVQRKDDMLYVKELLYKSGLTNYDLKKEFRALGISHGAPIYADSASPASIHELKQSEDGMLGYTVIPAEKNVRDGIKTVQEYHSNIVAHSASRNLVKEANGYQWRRGARGELLEEPVKHADHLMDALRYAIHTHLKTKRNPNRPGLKKM